MIENLHRIAATRQLTASRLPVLFLTLERNVQWWTKGPLLAYGARAEFAGAQLVREYYPGQGLELQVLGSFGKVDGMYTAGPSEYGQMEALVNEMLPLASADLATPPALFQLTSKATSGRSFPLRFTLSKVSHVGVVLTRASATMLATSASFAHGTNVFSTPALKPGRYRLALTATDLAGNFSRITGTVTVTRRRSSR